MKHLLIATTLVQHWAAAVALRRSVGYETLAMTRKGQVNGICGNDIVAQATFIKSLFDMAA